MAKHKWVSELTDKPAGRARREEGWITPLESNSYYCEKCKVPQSTENTKEECK